MPTTSPDTISPSMQTLIELLGQTVTEFVKSEPDHDEALLQAIDVLIMATIHMAVPQKFTTFDKLRCLHALAERFRNECVEAGARLLREGN